MPAPRPESVEEMIDRLCAKIPDYPEPGVLFRDLTPLFADGAAFARAVDALGEAFRGQFEYVAGIEARGSCWPVRSRAPRAPA